MKKVRFVLVFVVLAMALAAIVPAFAADPYEIIFVPKLIGIPWFTTMEKGFVDYGEKDGTLNVKIGRAHV